MAQYDYFIIGGGIAGVTAAEAIREYDSRATIGIFSDEPHILYSRVLLPHYLKKKISRDHLFLRKIDDFTKKRIDLHFGEAVSSVDIKRREVGFSNGGTVAYGKLLVASGGRVRSWGLKRDQKFIYRLQTLDDADRLFEELERIKKPLVIGGSFISLEFLEIFVLNKSAPALLFRDAHFFSKIIDPRGGEILRSNFEKYGVTVWQQDFVAGISRSADILSVDTQSLRKIECDALALGVGIDRNIGFLSDSGIELGENGIRVNEFLETNQKGVFAAGDVAEFNDTILGKYRTAGNWTEAFLQGKLAGANMVGKKERFKNISSYSITNFGLQITVLGECDGKLDSAVRVDEIKNQYERFFLRDGVLVGAALINRFQDKPHLSRLIEGQVRVDEYAEKLKSFEFDIRAISPVS